MSFGEWLVNILSVILFAILTFRLLQIVYSIPYRRQVLLDVHATIVRYRDSVEKQLELQRASNDVLSETCPKLQTPLTQSYDPCATMAMMHRAIRLRLSNKERAADARFGGWFEALAGDFDRHFALANLATDLGMLGTVAGGIFAFNHIDNADDPFAAFPSLALAMLTTAAGLIIAILVKLALGYYSVLLNNVVSFASRTLEDLVELQTQATPQPWLAVGIDQSETDSVHAATEDAGLGSVKHHG